MSEENLRENVKQNENLELSDIVSEQRDEEEQQILHNNGNSAFPYYDEMGKQKFQKNYTLIRILKIILAFAALAFVYVLFVDIMEHRCPEDKYPTDDDCMQYLTDNIFVWAGLLLISGGLILLVCQLAIHRYIERFFWLAAVALSVYLCLFKYNIDPSNVKVREFEGAHALFLMVVLIFLSIGLYLVMGCVNLFKSSRKIFASLYFVILCLFVWLYVEAEKSCDGWEKGLTGEIDNTGDYCYVEKPWVCWPVVVNNLLKFGPPDCELDDFTIIKNRDKVLEKFGFYKGLSEKEEQELLDNSFYLAWPRLEHYSNSDRKYDVIQEIFEDNTKIVESVQDGFDQGAEIVVDLKENKMEINVQRNETVVKNAQERYEKMKSEINHEPLSDNIVIVYIDTLSRAQTHRKMPKSMEYLKNFADPKDSTKKQIYEFYRFHSIDKKTNNNAFKMQFDYRYKEVYKDLEEEGGKFSEEKKIPNMMNEFRNAGYVTAQVMNTCTSQCLFREKYVPIQKYFNEDAADHEFTIWDPMYINPDNYYDVAQGPSSISRRCLYGNDTAAYMMEYTKQFMDAYKGEKKAVFMEFTDAHELTSEVIQFMDEHLERFLKSIEKHTDESTVVYFIADHGQHLIQPFYLQENKIDPDRQYEGYMEGSVPSQDVYQSERMLPLLQIMVSNDVLNRYSLFNFRENLKKNEQIILGMGEFRNTLMANAYGLGVDRYKNNVWGPRKSSLSCMDIEQVSELDPVQYCVCRPHDWKENI